MKNIKTYWIIGILIMVSSCETIVGIDLPEGNSVLTMNALINNNDNIAVSLHASKGIFEAGELQAVENGTVTLIGSDGTNISVDTPEFDGENFYLRVYTFPLVPKPDVIYTLRATAPGFEEVEAITFIPNETEIISVDTSSVFTKGYREGQINITFQDNSATEDSYEFKFYALVYAIDTTDGQFTYVPVVQEIYAYFSSPTDFFGGGDNELLLKDELFNGREYTQRINYDYQIPFLLGDTMPNDSIDLSKLVSTYLITELRTLSEDYYLFQSTYTTYQFSSGDPFAQPVQVYNNVENGFGIFAGFSSTLDTLRISKGLLPSPLDP